MQIAVIGTGYVGLVSGACFADFGIKVTCADIDERKIRQLKAGEIPFYEPGLFEKIQTNVEQGRLGFTTDVAAAIRDALVVIIAVGTPATRDGTPNLEAVETEPARSVGISRATRSLSRRAQCLLKLETGCVPLSKLKLTRTSNLML